ncbi:MAG TPA: metallopeptidase family protein [Verrucomicrobiota bacterium]|nr:hypothetical protein [Verrucomicrobiales bacterium]HRI13903.1 metallopeptidase family protein [Verrucomicrobiota bacterium]
MTGLWSELLEAAQDEVQQTIRALPDDLRHHAAGLAITYESFPGQALLDDGWDHDLLGMFIGDPIDGPEMSGAPRQIQLFLENLWDAAAGDRERFREEVRITLLHEFGHYLGLEEDDMEERGLL